LNDQIDRSFAERPEELEILEPEVEEEAEEAEQSLPIPSDLDLVQRYIREANRFALLTPEEEKALTTRFYETGDQETGSRLITSNLRLVIKIALEFQKYWMKNLLDLIQEGNIGLMHAIKKFDPYRGIKLSYYASFWIKAYILKFIMDNWKLVKIGTTQSQRKLFYNLKREKEKLRAQGFEPGPKLLAEALNVREEEVIEMDQRLGGWELSLDAPLKEGSDEYHKNFLPATDPHVEEILAQSELKGMFRKKLGEFRTELNDKELDILDLRLLAEKPMTLQEIGARHSISRERVRQIEDRLIKRLRHHLKNEIADWEDYRTPMED
jgi:RNA polymerase sigma-32 factor